MRINFLPTTGFVSHSVLKKVGVRPACHVSNPEIFTVTYRPTLAALSLCALLSFTPVARAEDAATIPLTRADVESIVRDYLVKNPQVVVDAITAFQQQQYVDQAVADAKALEENRPLLSDEALPVVGNPAGDVTVVEFFDYNCGYCKRAIKDVLELIDTDKAVRITLVDLPVLGSDSVFAARWALAAHKQGKYFEYHKALMTHPGHIDEKVLVEQAQKLGLDVDALRRDAADDMQIQQRVDTNMALARSLGLHGTPAFIVGDTVAKGYIGIDALKQAVAEIRKKAADSRKGK